jgi:amidophosphoribosyltransferase
MIDLMHEKCGVVAVIDLAGKQDVVPIAVDMTKGLQHRGQLGAGIAWLQKQEEGKMINVLKGPGQVKEILSPKAILQRGATGSAAIGHTRYATNTNLSPDMFHPLNKEKFAVAFNGNVSDYAEIERQLIQDGFPPSMEGDTEIIAQMLMRALQNGTRNKIAAAFKTLGQLDGSYNVVTLHNDGAISAIRDPRGMRPLAYAQNGSLLAIASETSAIRDVWHDVDTHDVQPGYLLHASTDRFEVMHEQLWMAERNLCFFEAVYFAEHRSIIDGISVSNVRYECGKILAENDEDLKNTNDLIVVPVPKSAKTAARGYADKKQIRNVEAILVDDEDVGRTFIAKTHEERVKKTQMKYRNIDSGLIANRRIVLVDDSLVRGTTMHTLVEMLRARGASEVHLRLASPPIMSPCFYGIDFPTVKELLARKYSSAPLKEGGVLPDDVLAAIAKDINVNSIKYLPVEAIPRALGKNSDEICMACVTGKYPTTGGQRLYQIAEETWNGSKPTDPKFDTAET